MERLPDVRGEPNRPQEEGREGCPDITALKISREGRGDITVTSEPSQEAEGSGDATVTSQSGRTELGPRHSQRIATHARPQGYAFVTHRLPLCVDAVRNVSSRFLIRDAPMHAILRVVGVQYGHSTRLTVLHRLL